MGDKFPGKAGLKDEEPNTGDMLLSMTGCCHTLPENLAREDFVREFGPNELLAVDSCVRLIIYKEGRMFDSWQIRWHHIFHLRFVVSDQEMSYLSFVQIKVYTSDPGFYNWRRYIARIAWTTNL